MQPLKDVMNHNLCKIGNISKLCGLSFSRKKPIGKRGALSTAISWLCRSQDITGCGGVATEYSFKNGWEPPYPETTGYLIETFYDYAVFSVDDSHRIRACEMGEL